MKVIFMSIRIDITILINEKGTLLCKIGTIYISIISYKYVSTDDSVNIVIPSNNLKKGYIRLIKLGTFFATKSQGGRR